MLCGPKMPYFYKSLSNRMIAEMKFSLLCTTSLGLVHAVGRVRLQNQSHQDYSVYVASQEVHDEAYRKMLTLNCHKRILAQKAMSTSIYSSKISLQMRLSTDKFCHADQIWKLPTGRPPRSGCEQCLGGAILTSIVWAKAGRRRSAARKCRWSSQLCTRVCWNFCSSPAEAQT